MKNSGLILILFCLFACEGVNPQPGTNSWILTATKTGDSEWVNVPESDQLKLIFLSDSTLSVVTDSVSCDGIYSVQENNGDPYVQTFTIKASCMTPEEPMWWTYQISNPKDGYIEVLPRLNPTAFLSNVRYRFKVTGIDARQ